MPKPSKINLPNKIPKKEPIKKKETPVIPAEKPPIKKPLIINYDLTFDIGEICPANPIVRAVPKDKDGNKLLGCEYGYGLTEHDAMKDFINRNKSEIIEKVFDRMVK